MKILYVEDDLSGSLDRLIRLFSKYLDEKTVDDLKRLLADDYGATPDEIKAIVESTNIIEIAYHFPDALRKIMHGYDRYACFIVDRNLIENPYEFREVNEIDRNYTENFYDKFREREGDYLLIWLATKTINPEGMLQKFNFLSAYPTGPNDEIRGVENIQTFIDMKTFKEDQFFEKGSPRMDDLKKKIDKIEVLNTQYENRVYLDILRNNLHEEDAEKFLEVLLEKDERNRIGKNLNEIRIIYEHVMEKFAATIPQCKDDKGKINIHIYFEKLEKNGQINQMLRNYCFTIWQVCSDYGSHKDKRPHKDRIFQPTLNSINSIIYALKEVILWLGDQFKQKK